jgi:hypothetical protein
MFNTEQYEAQSHFGGILLTRKSDAATLLFQPGDDADGFIEDLEGEVSEDEINIVCDQYAELFEV